MVLCLLLVGLVLYNPYMTCGESGGAGLCVRHSASHRATVGASELQYFNPTDSRHILATAAFRLLEVFGQIVPLGFEPHMAEVEDLPRNDESWSASLWFRPPPAI
jgi:hypothetical protein